MHAIKRASFEVTAGLGNAGRRRAPRKLLGVSAAGPGQRRTLGAGAPGRGRIASADGVPGGGIHIVRSGDRLGGVADRYGLSVSQLAQANQLRVALHHPRRTGAADSRRRAWRGVGPASWSRRARAGRPWSLRFPNPRLRAPRRGVRPLRPNRSRRWRWPSCRRRPGANLLRPPRPRSRPSPRSRQRPPVSAIPCARAKPCPGSRSASMSA